MRITTLPILTLAILVSLAQAADSPQWRGPARNGHSGDTGLLKQWPTGGPKLLGTITDAGTGYSSFAVVGDRLYSMGADASTEFVFAVDLKSMKKIWSTEIGKRFQNSYGDGPRATPTIDSDLLYVLGGQGNVVCVKTATGEKVWSKNMQSDFGGRMMSGWGYSESVLVDGEQVVCTPGGQKGTIVALNKKTGDLIWQSKEWTDPAAYCSIIPAEIGGTRQYVQMTNQNVGAVAAKDGKLLWKAAKAGRTAVCPTVVVANNLVYATAGYGVGCALFKVDGSGDRFQATAIYNDNKNMVNHHGGVVLVDGRIFGFSDGGRGGWTCQDLMTGDVVWANKGIGKGSLTYADGCFYCYSEGDGTVALIEASPTAWTPKGQFKIPQRTSQPHPRSRASGNNVWAHPVVANGKLFVRDQELIFVYDVRGQ